MEDLLGVRALRQVGAYEAEQPPLVPGVEQVSIGRPEEHRPGEKVQRPGVGGPSTMLCLNSLCIRSSMLALMMSPIVSQLRKTGF